MSKNDYLHNADVSDALLIPINTGAAPITSSFTNAAASVPIYYNNVRCGGGERRLIDCPKSGNTNPVCDHSRDAGVRCQGGEFMIGDC